MDVDTTGYRIPATEEAAERFMLEAQGYAVSEHLAINGVHVGFVAVRFDETQVVEAVIVVVEG